MNEKKIFNVEQLVAAIKEVAATIAENGGAEIKALVKEINDGEVVARIIIEPYRFIARDDH